MNFVHVSDTHLGASNFKLREREKDFLNAFRQVVDYSISEKVDFVIHSGDLFDKGKPGNNVLLFVINQLKKLKRARIPFVIIPGSHDMSVDGTFITVLERVGLLRNAGRPDNFVSEGDYFLMKGEEVGDAVIYGLPGRRDNISTAYEIIRPVASSKFRIFMFHHIITDVKDAEQFADIPISLLPKGMDYYAGGHWHEHAEFIYCGKPVIYPGSTEYGDVDAMEKHMPRGFIHVREKPVFIKLVSREVIVKSVDCNGLNPVEATSKCVGLIPKSSKGIIILKLYGILKSGKRNDIDSIVISNQASLMGFIHCNVRLSELGNPGETVTVSGLKSIDSLEREFLKGKGYDVNEISVAKGLIELLGKEYKPDELKKALIKAEGLL